MSLDGFKRTYHKPKMPGAENPIRFPEPVWKCKVCGWRFNDQVGWERCPKCGTLFSLTRIQTDEQVVDEFKLDKIFNISTREKKQIRNKSKWIESNEARKRRLKILDNK